MGEQDQYTLYVQQINIIQKLELQLAETNKRIELLEKVLADSQRALADSQRALAVCEGSLRNSGNMVQDLNDECLRLQGELGKLAK